MVSVSQVQLYQEHLGIVRIDQPPKESLEVANRLLQKNHDEHHMFWRRVGGHNHTVHSVLNVLALGGSPSDLQRAYDDDADIQRPLPPLDQQVVESLENPEQFRARLGQLDQYTNFLVFFKQQIKLKGPRAVLNEYLFSRSPNAETMFAQLYEGLYHPVIHLGLGIEFHQPTIIAEGLAQAASHDSMGFEGFLVCSETKALKTAISSKPLVQLLHDVRMNDVIRSAPFGFEDGVHRVRDGVFGKAGQEIVSIAAQFRVKPDEVELRLAEIINLSGYTAGCAQRPGKARKIDFFYLHNVTASMALTVLIRQPWISNDDKVRLLEWTARTNLAWYAGSAAADLGIDDVIDYTPRKCAGMDWAALARAVNAAHDDGHLAKFVRALKNGEDISKPFEQGEGADTFPIKGNMWLKLAQMGYDSTVDLPVEQKWIWGVGFDENWIEVPVLELE